MPLNIFGDGYGFDEDGKCGFSRIARREIPLLDF